MLEHSIRFHKNLERPIIDNTLLGLHRMSGDSLTTPLRVRNSTFSGGASSPSLLSVDPSGKVPPILAFEDDESKEFMICFLSILKNLKSGKELYFVLQKFQLDCTNHFKIGNSMYKIYFIVPCENA